MGQDEENACYRMVSCPLDETSTCMNELPEHLHSDCECRHITCQQCGEVMMYRFKAKHECASKRCIPIQNENDTCTFPKVREEVETIEEQEENVCYEMRSDPLDETRTFLNELPEHLHTDCECAHITCQQCGEVMIYSFKVKHECAHQQYFPKENENDNRTFPKVREEAQTEEQHQFDCMNNLPVEDGNTNNSYTELREEIKGLEEKLQDLPKMKKDIEDIKTENENITRYNKKLRQVLKSTIKRRVKEVNTNLELLSQLEQLKERVDIMEQRDIEKEECFFKHFMELYATKKMSVSSYTYNELREDMKKFEKQVACLNKMNQELLHIASEEEDHIVQPNEE